MSRKPRVSFARFSPQARAIEIERHLLTPALVDHALGRDDPLAVPRRQLPGARERHKVVLDDPLKRDGQEFDAFRGPVCAAPGFGERAIADRDDDQPQFARQMTRDVRVRRVIEDPQAGTPFDCKNKDRPLLRRNRTGRDGDLRRRVLAQREAKDHGIGRKRRRVDHTLADECRHLGRHRDAFLLHASLAHHRSPSPVCRAWVDHAAIR
ncbi:hypothetical protein [Sphingomonas aerolata]|uniref:hypothetical protein n=1 Tax=Sphingomonas aerolata TaxID=185951 RepID=UPI003A5C42FB